MTDQNSHHEPAPLRIATRASPLAMAQARLVADALPVETELLAISTRGDRTARALTEVGGKGLFTADLESALRRGEVHLAVHSAKDLPATPAGDMTVVAVLGRADPRDALVSNSGAALHDLPRGSRVGTSSLRRAAQLRAARPDVEPAAIRGNVDTRLAKLGRGEYDGVILAMAGLERLGVLDELAGRVRPLATEQFVPAAGQGVLAAECLTLDQRVRELLESIRDAGGAAALAAERSVVRAVGATCRSAFGVHIGPDGDAWRGVSMAAGEHRAVRESAAAASAELVAERLIERLKQAGADRILRP